MFSLFGKSFIGIFVFLWLLGRPDVLGLAFFAGIGILLLKFLSKDIWDLFMGKSKDKIKKVFKPKTSSNNNKVSQKKKPDLVLKNCSPLTKYLLEAYNKDDRELLLRHFKRECSNAWHLCIVSLDKSHKNLLTTLSTGHLFLSPDVLDKILIRAKAQEVTLGKVYDVVDDIKH